jgi:hypothetical protein
MAMSDENAGKLGCAIVIFIIAIFLSIGITSYQYFKEEQDWLVSNAEKVRVIDKDITDVSSGPLAGDEEGHFIRVIIYDKDDTEMTKKWLRVSEGKYGKFYIDSTYPSSEVDVTRSYHDDNFR